MTPRAIPCATLVAGQVVELPETGERYEVVRVTPCSATVRPVLSDSKHVVLCDDQGVVMAEFESLRGGRRVEWSPCALVRVVS